MTSHACDVLLCSWAEENGRPREQDILAVFEPIIRVITHQRTPAAVYVRCRGRGPSRGATYTVPMSLALLL